MWGRNLFMIIFFSFLLCYEKRSFGYIKNDKNNNIAGRWSHAKISQSAITMNNSRAVPNNNWKYIIVIIMHTNIYETTNENNHKNYFLHMIYFHINIYIHDTSMSSVYISIFLSFLHIFAIMKMYEF